MYFYTQDTLTASLDVVEEGEGDEEEDGDEGEEGGGEEELEDALLRDAWLTISLGRLLLHSSSSWGSTNRVTSFPVRIQRRTKASQSDV